MSDPLADLLAEVKSGAPLAEVLADFLPADEREALDRCAALRRFDRATFAVACADLPGAARERFEDVVMHPDVRSLGAGSYRVRSDARRRRFDRWLAESDGGVPAWLRDLSERLVAHFASEEARDELEALYHEFAVDPALARKRMQRQFAAADRAFNLARCQDIVDAAGERIGLAGPALGEDVSRMRAQLKARIRWSGEWYRTASFVPPATSRATVDELLAPSGPRALEIGGEEGMGRTTHLQWLIARRCVPAGIACARLDLNDIGDPALAAQEPWLLLLEIARQLDPQLPDAPFQPLLLKHEIHAGRLRWLADRMRPRKVAARAPESAADRGRLEAEVRDSFFDVLLALPASQRVLVVADSVDPALSPEISRAGDPRIKAVIGELALVADRVESALVVVASRRFPARGVPRLRRKVPTLRLRLAKLSEDEARAYLRAGGRRALDRAIEDAAIHAGRGVPMRLAVLADVLRRRPAITAEELAALHRADELGLAEPILAQLPPALRLALRYGAAPLTLDVECFEQVVAPFVAELPDTPEVDAAALWRDVRDFAAVSPWVDLAGPDAVRFHMMFKRPIREQLRDTAEMREFSKRARSFFLERAEQDPDQWGAWMSEALFHEFLQAGTDTVASWREMMRAAQERDARHAERLAFELLRLAGGGRGVGTDELVTAATDAWIAAAWAAVRAAREAPGRPRGHDGWQRARVALDEIRARETATPPPSAAQIAGLEAALRGRDGRAASAVVVLQGALPHARTPQDRLTLHAELARALEHARPADAADEYRRARRIAARLPDASPDVATIDRRFARHLMDRDLYATAEARCAMSLERVAPETRIGAELAQLRAEILLRTGRPSAAAAIADRLARLTPAGARGRHRAGLLRAWTDIATWRPEAAVARLTQMLERVEADGGGAPGVEIELRMAQIRELRAQARLRLLDTAGGLDDLEYAMLSFEQAGLGSRLRSCLAGAAELQLRHLGDVRAAGLTLDRLAVAARTAEREGELVGELRRIEWLDHTRQPHGLHARLEEIAAELRRGAAPPRRLIAVAIEGLAVTSDPRPNGWLELLAEQLERVQTAGARLLLLGELCRCGPVPDPRREAADVIDRLTSSVPDAPPPRDRGMLLTTHADVARVCGRAATARRRMQAARMAVMGEPMEPYARRRLLEAFDRFGLGRDEQSALDGPAIALSVPPDEPLTSHPSSGAALLIQSAWEAGRAGMTPAAAEKLLEAAERLLDRPHADGKWLAALHETRESMAKTAGDEPRARRHRTRAAVLQFRLDEHAAPAPTNGSPEQGAPVRVELRRRSDGLGVRPAGAGHEAERVATSEFGLLLALPEQAPVDELVRWVARREEEFGAAAAEALFTPDVREELKAGGERGLTLLLSSRDRRAHALPWELALESAPPDVRAAIGRIERTAPAVAVATAPADAPRRVTVFCPPAAGTGLRIRAARPLEDRYRVGGWDVRVEHGFSPVELERGITTRAPSVAHFECSLVFSSGTAMLDVGTDGIPTVGRHLEREHLTASRLARAALPVDAAPLFVMDPPAVAGRLEFARQLLLRNLFAAELFTLVARPVLCTGFAPPGDRDALAEALVDGLADALDPRAVARERRYAALFVPSVGTSQAERSATAGSPSTT